MTWSTRTEPLPEGGGVRLVVDRAERAATVADVIAAWRGDADFRAAFSRALAAVPYTSFRWETPATTAATVGRPFECVVLDSALSPRADPSAFRAHLDAATGDVAVFPSLGGDAVLVVPCPRGAPSAYAHLAAFLRGGPASQQDALWRAVGEAMARRVGPRPVWLSTAGAGVPWLHVRLDDRPKYVHHAPYRLHPGDAPEREGR